MPTDQIAIFIEQYATKELVDPDVEAFLEHYGRRGQRWGVTNRSSSSGSSHRVAKGLGRAALVTGGAVAGVLIAKHFNIPMKSLKGGALLVGGVSTGAVLAGTLLKKHGQTRADEIKNARQVLFGGK